MTTDADIARWLRNYADRREYKDGMRVVAGKLRDAADAIEGKERQSAAPAQGTVRVRIACVVSAGGLWRARGGSAPSDYVRPDQMASGAGAAGYWVTADLPMPAAQEIAGRVEGGDD